MPGSPSFDAPGADGTPHIDNALADDAPEINDAPKANGTPEKQSFLGKFLIICYNRDSCPLKNR